MWNNKPVFSVVIPVHNRAETGQLERCLRSLIHQSYPHWEAIVVDDYSSDHPERVVASFHDTRLHWTRLPEHSQRCIARNVGMKVARGDWITWLDSDDEFLSIYFQALVEAMADYPQSKVFNFGALCIWYDKSREPYVPRRTTVRPSFQPALSPDGVGHVPFKSGGIGCGSFVFHRLVYEAIGPLPPARDPSALHRMAVEGWSEIAQLYPLDGVTLGNPWGEDWLYCYLMTRRFTMQSLDMLLYVQHVR